MRIHRTFIRQFILYVLQLIRSGGETVGSLNNRPIDLDEFKDFLGDEQNIRRIMNLFLDELHFRSTNQKVKIFSNLEKLVVDIYLEFKDKFNPAFLGRYGYDKKTQRFLSITHSRLVSQAAQELTARWQEVSRHYNLFDKHDIRLDLVGSAFNNDLMQPMIGVEIKHDIDESFNRDVIKLRRRSKLEYFYIYTGLWYNLDLQKYELHPIRFKDAINEAPSRQKFWKGRESELSTAYSIPNNNFTEQIDDILADFMNIDFNNVHQRVKKLSKVDREIELEKIKNNVLMVSHIPAIDNQLLDRFDKLYAVTTKHSLILSNRHFQRLTITQMIRNFLSHDHSLINRNRFVLYLNPNLLEENISFRNYKNLVELLYNSDLINNDQNLKTILHSYKNQSVGMQQEINLGRSLANIRESYKSQLLGLYILLLLMTVQEGGFLLILLPASDDEDESPILDYLFSYDYDDDGNPINAFDITSTYLDPIFTNQKTDYSILSIKRPLIELYPEELISDEYIDEVEEYSDRETEQHGLLAGGLHWLKNKLTGPVSNIELANDIAHSLLKDNNFTKEQKDNIDNIIQFNTEAFSILKGFEESLKNYVNYHGNNPPNYKKHNLLTLIQSFEKTVYTILKENDCSIDYKNIPEDIEIVVDDDKIINQVFIAIIKNSLKHGFDEKHNQIKLTFSANKITDNDNKEWININIQDDGRGMLKAKANKLLEIEIRPENTRWGIINLVKVIKNHHGKVNFKSTFDGINGFLTEIKLNTPENQYKIIDQEDGEIK